MLSSRKSNIPPKTKMMSQGAELDPHPLKAARKYHDLKHAEPRARRAHYSRAETPKDRGARISALGVDDYYYHTVKDFP